ncbi:MAG: NAD(P)-dependent oxidoreductase [Candidatus Improbicoccus devescovinae]|nr:MAG: NAD(P)-dependent oxidoreductase [Candidatus Improbicoccus devescovinae]
MKKNNKIYHCVLPDLPCRQIYSVFKTLGASNHTVLESSKRPKSDFYATDPNALKIFLKKLEEDDVKLLKKIIEPACGAGHLSKELIKQRYIVFSSDLYDHGFGMPGVDFLQSEEKAECFLTNPPYKNALEFCKHAIENLLPKGYAIMLLRIQFLESKARNKFFRNYPPKFIYVNSSRQFCAKNDDFFKSTSAVCYAWFVW